MWSFPEETLATSRKPSSNTISSSTSPFAVTGLVLLTPRGDSLILATKPSLILPTSTSIPPFLVDVDDDTDSDCGDSCRDQDQAPQGLPEAIEGSKSCIPIPIVPQKSLAHSMS